MRFFILCGKKRKDENLVHTQHYAQLAKSETKIWTTGCTARMSSNTSLLRNSLQGLPFANSHSYSYSYSSRLKGPQAMPFFPQLHPPKTVPLKEEDIKEKAFQGANAGKLNRQKLCRQGLHLLGRDLCNFNFK